MFSAFWLKSQIGISCEVLATRDVSLQFPDGKAKDVTLYEGRTASAGIMVQFSLSPNIFLESGYRWKDHLITYSNQVKYALSVDGRFFWKSPPVGQTGGLFFKKTAEAVTSAFTKI